MAIILGEHKMKFQLKDQLREKLLSALFPDFSDRLQIACYRYLCREYDEVLVTSSDEVDVGSFPDGSWMVSIGWDDIDVCFEAGDPYSNFTGKLTNKIPEDEAALFEYDTGYTTERGQCYWRKNNWVCIIEKDCFWDRAKELDPHFKKYINWIPAKISRYMLLEDFYAYVKEIRDAKKLNIELLEQ